MPRRNEMDKLNTNHQKTIGERVAENLAAKIDAAIDETVEILAEELQFCRHCGCARCLQKAARKI